MRSSCARSCLRDLCLLFVDDAGRLDLNDQQLEDLELVDGT